MANKDIIKLFELLCKRFTEYSEEKRAATQPTRLAELKKLHPAYKYNPQDSIIREPLIEHVGSLPVVATTLYPFIGRDDINLGEALIMLAIHDIGELLVGDTITFAKSREEDDDEEKAALTILEPIYHDYYKRIEHQTDPTAQFAKTVDKMTPDIIDFLNSADDTMQRYESFMGTGTPEDIIQMKIDHKLRYMVWDKKVEELFRYILDQTREKLAKHE